MDYKEIWCHLFDLFKEENGREPTDEEMREEWACYCEDMRGCHE
jgi:hypothetical protein